MGFPKRHEFQSNSSHEIQRQVFSVSSLFLLGVLGVLGGKNQIKK
jgi:hypothetical protein